ECRSAPGSCCGGTRANQGTGLDRSLLRRVHKAPTVCATCCGESPRSRGAVFRRQEPAGDCSSLHRAGTVQLPSAMHLKSSSHRHVQVARKKAVAVGHGNPSQLCPTSSTGQMLVADELAIMGTTASIQRQQPMFFGGTDALTTEAGRRRNNAPPVMVDDS